MSAYPKAATTSREAYHNPGRLVHELATVGFRPKLKLDHPGDVYEQEADEIADRVMRSRPGGDEADSPDGECCSGRVQRQAVPVGPPAQGQQLSSATEFRIRSGGFAGQPLPGPTRAFFEPRFGRHLGDVRVHTGPDAAQLNDDVQAHAFTHGSHIWLGSGLSPEPSQVLAHELTHVLQQAGSAAATSTTATQFGPGQVAGQSSAPGTPQVIRRKPQGGTQDRCAEHQAPDPCGSSTNHQTALLAPYRAKAWERYADLLMQDMSVELGTLEEIVTEPPPPAARSCLLRIACCQLEPEDAALVRETFAERRGSAGRVFDKLSAQTRSDLLAILDDRASRVGRKTAEKLRRKAESEFASQERERARQRADEAKFVRLVESIAVRMKGEDYRAEGARIGSKLYPVLLEMAADARFRRDLELHAKAGRFGLIDFFSPFLASQYRISYADRINNEVLRGSARLAERGANVSVFRAVLDPVTRPVTAIVRFVECLITSLKGEDFRAVGSRFDLELYAWLSVFFGPGAAFGAALEAHRMAKEILKFIKHPIKFANEVLNMVKLLWAPNSSELGCAMGQDLGGEISGEIGALANLPDPELAYGLGKLAGPLLLNTMIALIAPEAMAVLKGTRFAKRLLSLLKNMRSEWKFLKKWRRTEKVVATGLKEDAAAGRGAGTVAEDLGEILEGNPPKKKSGLDEIVRDELEDKGFAREDLYDFIGKGKKLSARYAQLVARLLDHFTPEEVRAFGEYLAKHKMPLNEKTVELLLEEVPQGKLEEWIDDLEKIRDDLEKIRMGEKAPSAEISEEELAEMADVTIKQKETPLREFVETRGSKVLRASLIERAGGVEPHPGYHAHHIIPEKQFDGLEWMRERLRDAGSGINEADNGVFLAGSKSTANPDLTRLHNSYMHAGPSKEYAYTLTRRLANLHKKEFLDEVLAIGKEMADGEFHILEIPHGWKTKWEPGMTAPIEPKVKPEWIDE